MRRSRPRIWFNALRQLTISFHRARELVPHRDHAINRQPRGFGRLPFVPRDAGIDIAQRCQKQ